MFFTIDAIFALMIVIIFVTVFSVMHMTSLNPQAYQKRLSIEAEDAISVVSGLSISDVRDEKVIEDLYSRGMLGSDDTNKYLVDVIGMMWASQNETYLEAASNISETIIARVMPENVQWKLQVEDDTLYNTTALDVRGAAAVGRRIVSGYMKSYPSSGYVAKVYLKSIAGKNTAAYIFYGGFVGEGNITSVMSSLPSDAAVKNIYMEMGAASNFTLFINAYQCGNFTKLSSDYIAVDNWSVTDPSCLSRVIPGQRNNFTIAFSDADITKNYIGGGYIKVSYETAAMLDEENYSSFYFPGIDGIINYYDSFYIPGNITAMAIHLEIDNNYSTYLNIGNATVFNSTGSSSKQVIDLANSTLDSLLDYREMSFNTIPIHMFSLFPNVTGVGGNADVVLITDVSGSMNWRMNQDYSTGTERSCGSPSLFDNSTKRISVARCVDQDFVQDILSLSGNRVALVSFNGGISNYTELSNNSAYLNYTISLYSAGGSTCIACAINKAYEILAVYSSSGRTKHVIVMSDGVANVRASGWCELKDIESKDGIDFITGDSGGFIHFNSTNSSKYTDYYSGMASSVSSVSPTNSLFAIAAGADGYFYRWNGTDWISVQDVGGTDFFGVSVLNSTFGLAAGTDGHIYKLSGGSWVSDSDTGSHTWRGISVANSTNAVAAGYRSGDGYLARWNGASWSVASRINNVMFYDVKFTNSTQAFAVGKSGKIYRWSGASWSQYQDTGSQTWYAISVVNSTGAFVAGSDGSIYRWDGTSFSSFTSPTAQQINGIVFYNDSAGKIITENGLVYAYSYGIWTLARDARSTGTFSTGTSCGDPDWCTDTFANNFAAQNANWSSCRLREHLNTTNYAVGFGPVATCSLGNRTLVEIAKCGNGSYYASSDADELASIYQNIATSILNQSFVKQVVAVSGNIPYVKLYPNSYINFSYQPNQFYGEYQNISVRMETNPFPSCNGSFFVPSQMRISDVKATSYSGDYWTHQAYFKSPNTGNEWSEIFMLGRYGTNYLALGDPYALHFDANITAGNATNYINITLGTNPSNTSSYCSNRNRIIYTARIKSSVPYGENLPSLSGFNVTVYYDSNHDGAADGSVNVAIGTGIGFNSTLIGVEQLRDDDALHDAFSRLLHQLNFYTGANNTGNPGSLNNPLDIRLSESIDVNYTSMARVPYFWGPVDVSIVTWI